MSDFYADRLGNVTVAGGVVRLDFARLVSVDKDKNTAQFAPAMRLVLPLDGMLHAIGMLDRVRDDLIKQARELEAARAAGSETASAD